MEIDTNTIKISMSIYQGIKVKIDKLICRDFNLNNNSNNCTQHLQSLLVHNINWTSKIILILIISSNIRITEDEKGFNNLSRINYKNGFWANLLNWNKVMIYLIKSK